MVEWMSRRRRASVLAAAVAVLALVAVAQPAAADSDPVSPFDFVPAAALESAKQVRADGAVLVEVYAQAGAFDTMLAAVSELIEIESVAADYGVVVGWAQPDALDVLDALPSVGSVETPPPPTSGSLSRSGASAALPLVGASAAWTTAPSCRAVPVEADGPLGTAVARALYGTDGTGVTIGVISDSFAAAGASAATTAEQDVLRGVLPGPANPCGYTTPVGVVADGDTGFAEDEGRAMAQLVHGIAPGARILFAAGGPSAYVMADRIRALVAAGADVIVDDLTYFGVPMFQSGPVEDAQAEAVAAGVAYFTSAGNGSFVSEDTGRQVASWYSDAFAPIDCPAALGGTTGNTGCMNFGSTADPDTSQRIRLARDDEGALSLVMRVSWNEPWYGVDAPLAVFALTTSPTPTVVAAAVCPIDSPLDPYVCERSSLNLVLSDASGLLPPDDVIELDVVVMRGPTTPVDPATVPTPGLRLDLSRPTAGSWLAMEHDESVAVDGRQVIVGTSILHNSGGPSAFTVGAAPVATPGALESFSSFGPLRHDWAPLSSEPAGTPAAPLASPWIRSGPDAVSIDGVITTFFGDDDRFFGTSAAAPTAAAVAALLLAASPGTSPEDVYQALRDSGSPITGLAGVADENAIGAGLIEASAALIALGAVPDPLAAPVPPVEVPADTAALVAAQGDAGVPELATSVSGSTATVRGIPGVAAGDWVWAFSYSTPADRGWVRAGAGGAVTVGIAGLADGLHHLAFFRGDDLLATSLFLLGADPAEVLPATGSDTGAIAAAASSALLAGALLLGLRAARRRRGAAAG